MKLFGYSINLGEWQGIVLLIAAILGLLGLCWVMIRLNKILFRHLQKKQKNLKLSFFEHLCAILILIGIIVFAFSMFNGMSAVWKTVLGGTAIISAVLVFAAQDVIKDILAGLMLSIHHPFEIGSRIELENGTAGIVEEMTLRHVVIHELDSARVVLPNSKINAMSLTNLSYQTSQRSIQFRFSVGYDCDVEQARQVIYDAILESPCSVPERKPDGTEAYRKIYFLAFAESALIMATTVYFDPIYSTEVVKDDINTRVREALMRNGIEIPYNYVNVVQK